MTVLITDMTEVAVVLIVIIIRIAIVTYFALYLWAALNHINVPEIIASVDWAKAGACGLQRGLIGVSPLGGC